MRSPSHPSTGRDSSVLFWALDLVELQFYLTILRLNFPPEITFHDACLFQQASLLKWKQWCGRISITIILAILSNGGASPSSLTHASYANGNWLLKARLSKGCRKEQPVEPFQGIHCWSSHGVLAHAALQNRYTEFRRLRFSRRDTMGQ